MRGSYERLLWLIAACNVVVAALGRWHPSDQSVVALPFTERVSGIPEPSGDSLQVMAEAVIDGDPFRLERKPASVRFGERPPEPPPQTVTAPSPILLTLSGTIGPPWQAIVEGIPGKIGGTVVRAGEVYGSVRIVSVGRDTVVVQGEDSTWAVTVKDSGQ